MRKGLIYCLKCPISLKIRYIGQTITPPKRRFSGHIADAKKGKIYHNANWIKSLLEKDLLPIIEVIEDNISKQDLDSREIFWINYYKNIGYHLTNETLGGYSHKGYVISEETRKKKSETMKKLAREGFYNNPERSRKISEFNKGKVIPEEMKKRISNTLKGKKLPEEIIAKLRRFKIYSIDRSTGIREDFLCISDAAKQLNINKGPISNVISGRQKSAYNRFWFKNEDIVES